jgi:hypothetical protein
MSSLDRFSLTEDELHQAMVLNRLSLRMLNQLLGLVHATRALPAALLLLERINHCDDASAIRQQFEDIGAQEGGRIAQALKPVICGDWDFCKRRSTDGLGDPRRLINSLASVIGPALINENPTPGDKVYLMSVCLYLSRSRLSALCKCDDKASSGPNEGPPTNLKEVDK